MDFTSCLDVVGGSAGKRAVDGAMSGRAKIKYVPKDRELTSVSVLLFLSIYQLSLSLVPPEGSLTAVAPQGSSRAPLFKMVLSGFP